MRFRILLVLSLLVSASSVFAVDRWIPIAGTVANFRTDTRVLNPSGEKDIEISAWFLPAGATNNASVIAGAPKKFTVAKRSMVVLDDVVTTLFSASNIGAILFTCPDNFVATSRIYATVATGTLGQFTVALGPGLAYTKGVVIQLQADSTFRTNIGAVNIANASTDVTWNLYDKSNKKIATVTKTMAAYEVLGPSNIATFFLPSLPASADISQAWVGYQSTNPIFAYGSSRDLRTDDPIYIPGEQDTGSDPVVVTPVAKEFDITLVSFDIVVAGNLNDLKVGDAVKMNVHGGDGSHGFALVGPDGAALVPDNLYSAGDTKTFNFNVTKTGTYTYFCTFTSCGTGHTAMAGTFAIR